VLCQALSFSAVYRQLLEDCFPGPGSVGKGGGPARDVVGNLSSLVRFALNEVGGRIEDAVAAAVRKETKDAARGCELAAYWSWLFALFLSGKSLGGFPQWIVFFFFLSVSPIGSPPPTHEPVYAYFFFVVCVCVCVCMCVYVYRNSQ
jgi:hypothetical protein